jgi:8-oxo-dGTP pyrophosphatase MutT (NUDIX family)
LLSSHGPGCNTAACFPDVSGHDPVVVLCLWSTGPKLRLTGSLVVVELLPFDEYVRSLHRKRMSAGVLFRDPEGRILLVEPSYKPNWDIPGGGVDEGEAPWTAAVREVREEIGLERSLGRPLVIDHQPDDGQMPEGMAFVFDGGLVSQQEVSDLVLTDPEIVTARLVTLVEAVELVKPTLARRLAVALDVIHTGELALCENGKRLAG